MFMELSYQINFYTPRKGKDEFPVTSTDFG